MDIPLYQSQLLCGVGAVVVEGEKTAERLQGFFNHNDNPMVAVGTVTGAETIPSDDVLGDLLNQEVIYLWPDADEVGRKHMRRIGERLADLGAADVRWIEWLGAPDKGDAVDAIADEVDIRALIDGAQPVGDASPPLPFRTALAIFQEEPENVAWVVHGLLARGVVTELAAKVKAGKTTLSMAMMKAVVEGKPFLGFPTEQARVLYLTEERPSTVRAVLARVGLQGSSWIEVMSITGRPHLPWDAFCAAVVRHAHGVKAGVVVVDTLSRWSGIKDENDAYHAAMAMEPLEKVAAAGLALLVARHDRKASGEIGDAGRGSSAISGAADILLSLKRANVEGHPNRRVLEGVGRLDDVPDQLIIEWQDGVYTNLGTNIAVERVAAEGKCLEVLPAEPPGMSMDDLIEKTGMSRSTLQRALGELAEKGRAAEGIGAGKTGRAKGYYLVDCPAPRMSGHKDSHDEPTGPSAGDVPTLRDDPGQNRVATGDEPIPGRGDISTRDNVLPSPLPLDGQQQARLI